jgi:hypothetical protein
MFAKRVCLEMAPAKWQGRALIFSLLAAGKTVRVDLYFRDQQAQFGSPRETMSGMRNEFYLPQTAANLLTKLSRS